MANRKTEDTKNSAAEKPVAKKAVEEKKLASAKPVAAEKPVAKKAVEEKKPTGAKPVAAEKPAAKKAVEEKKPASAKPVAAEKPVAKKAVEEKKPTSAKSAGAEKPVAKKAVDEKKPASAKSASAEKPAVAPIKTTQKEVKPAATATAKKSVDERDKQNSEKRKESNEPTDSVSSKKKAEEDKSNRVTAKESKSEKKSKAGAEATNITVNKTTIVNVTVNEKEEKQENTPSKTSKKKKRLIVIISVAAAVVIAFTGTMLGFFLPRKSDLPPIADEEEDKTDVIVKDPADLLYQIKQPIATQVGFKAEYLGTVERKIPTTVSDGGLVTNGEISAYPTYGTTVNYTTEQKNKVIAESKYLCTSDTRNGGGPYNRIDENGYLYMNDTPVMEGSEQRKLYKHSMADSMYYGNLNDRSQPAVANDEPAIVKRVTMKPRSIGYSVTGVYAPAGEVLKVQISEADMNAVGNIKIHIGQALYNDKANNIWAQKNINRMPVILNTFVISPSNATLENGVYTAYIGSFLGGPVYIVNRSVTYSVTISGGVRYSHFILGYTTPEEFAENAKSSAPYFDLEVWDNGVLHSGPNYYAKPFSYDDLYKAAVLWDKISIVSTTVHNDNIVFLYDPFVAAGAAVAFPGQHAVNCPAGWMANSLNYNVFVNSGAWGNMHEYNHNFQGFGCLGGSDGEITNNSINLVEYSLFTKISSARQLASYGGGGLSGWNCYTSATWALNRVKNKQIDSTDGLAVYATLLHNFGQDAYMKSARGKDETFFLNWGNNTHQNMSYFTSMIATHLTSDYSASLNEQQSDYPMFVPVSSVYQTGRSYMYDGEKRYIETMQPYVIQYGSDYTVDLTEYRTVSGQYSAGSVVLPEDFTYRVKSVTQPKYGSIKETENPGVYVYTPDKKNLRSGKIYVTLEITHKEDAFAVDDVDLVLEFEQSHYMNKTTLERTTYLYPANRMYTDPVEAYTNNYEGAIDRIDGDNINRNQSGKIIQDGNAEIWVPTPTENAVMELRGKLYISEDGKYRFALRGRRRAALYLSFDNGETYDLAVNMSENTSLSANFDPNGNYFDKDNLKAGQWIYFKAVLPVTYAGSFIGVGIGKFEQPGGTFEEGENPSEENRADVEETVTVAYANAYRCSYEDTDTGFTSDYFYQRTYTASYSQAYSDLTGMKLVESADNSPCADNAPIENLFDNDPATYCSSTRVVNPSSGNAVERDPWQITVDLGKTITANRFELRGALFNGNSSKNQTPNSITLYVGESPADLKEVASFNNGNVSGTLLAFNFDVKTFRCYKLVVRKTVEGRYVAIGNIEFSYQISNGRKISPDDQSLVYKGSWNQVNMFTTFGHINEGANGSVTFEFTGTQFGICSYFSESYEDFDVFIDGEKVKTVSLKKDSNAIEYAYLSDLLTNGKHTVTLKSKNKFNVESVVLW